MGASLIEVLCEINMFTVETSAISIKLVKADIDRVDPNGSINNAIWSIDQDRFRS